MIQLKGRRQHTKQPLFAAMLSFLKTLTNANNYFLSLTWVCPVDDDINPMKRHIVCVFRGRRPNYIHPAMVQSCTRGSKREVHGPVQQARSVLCSVLGAWCLLMKIVSSGLRATTLLIAFSLTTLHSVLIGRQCSTSCYHGTRIEFLCDLLRVIKVVVPSEERRRKNDAT